MADEPYDTKNEKKSACLCSLKP